MTSAIPFRERLSCTIPEACAATGLGRTKLYEQIGAGRVQTRKFGTRTLIVVEILGGVDRSGFCEFRGAHEWRFQFKGGLIDGKVLLFSIPKVEPPPEGSSAAGDFSHLAPWATEHLRELQQERRKLHAGILERAAIVAQVFGMPELAKMNVDDASDALVELTRRRADICAVLQGYYDRTSVADRKAG